MPSSTRSSTRSTPAMPLTSSRWPSARYRGLAEARWARVAELRPRASAEARYGARFAITHLMDRLADRDGDSSTDASAIS
jgi:hypothetical protein